MGTDHWIEWSRRELATAEASGILAPPTPDQRDQLAEEDYVWIRGIGVLYRNAEGRLERARFTHGTHFRTRRGEYYIGSDGAVTPVAPPQSRSIAIKAA